MWYFNNICLTSFYVNLFRRVLPNPHTISFLQGIILLTPITWGMSISQRENIFISVYDSWKNTFQEKCRIQTYILITGKPKWIPYYQMWEMNWSLKCFVFQLCFHQSLNFFLVVLNNSLELFLILLRKAGVTGIQLKASYGTVLFCGAVYFAVQVV